MDVSEGGDSPPPMYWEPPADVEFRQRQRRPPSPPLFSSSVSIIIIPSIALFFLFVALPSLFSKFTISGANHHHHHDFTPVCSIPNAPAKQSCNYNYNYDNYNYNPQPTPRRVPKPTVSVKKGWDSLNFFLVVTAILCGLFARRNDGAAQQQQPRQVEDPPQEPLLEEVDENRDPNVVNRRQFLETSSFPVPPPLQFPHQCFQYSDNHKIYGLHSPSPLRRTGTLPLGIGVNRLRRSSTSNPDLMRQEADLWEEDTVNRRRGGRFFDDFDIHLFQSSSRERVESQIPVDDEIAAASDTVEPVGTEIDEKEIPVDTVVLQTESDGVVSEILLPDDDLPPLAPPSPAPPPSPPLPPPVSRSKPKRTYEAVPHEKKTTKYAPPPPPPPPPLLRSSNEKEKKKKKKSDHGGSKRTNATKEIAIALATLYSHRKRKRKQKSNKQQHDHHHIDTTEGITATARMLAQHHSQLIPPPSPPPPPPPPPPSVFHSFFRKGIKHKKVHSISAAAPPPPPPPPPRQISSHPTAAKPPIPTARRDSNGKPPLPAARPTAAAYYEGNQEILNSSGSLSPLIPIPPPPPPPPFRMPDMKFSVVRGGGFVRVRSANSSRAGSPELEEEVELSTKAECVDESQPLDEIEMDEEGGGGGVRSELTCPTPPSPDVNVKADNFIARHHYGWRLEKLGSWTEKRRF